MQSSWARENIPPNWADPVCGEWFASARPQQYPLLFERPVSWLVSGGRGAGKTRLGAEWVNGLVHGFSPFTEPHKKYGHIALVGETLGDVREVMVEGISGILAVRGAGGRACR